MSGTTSPLDAVRAKGAVALLDLVQSPTHEARLAFPSLVKSVLERSGGRLKWSGSIDQQFIGRGGEHFDDVLVTEYPSRESLAAALTERASWQPESFVSEIRTFASAPLGGWRRLAISTTFGVLGLRGGGPPVFDPTREARPTWEDLETGDAAFGPDTAQLDAMLDEDMERRVVMLNLLRFRETARYADAGVDAEPGASGRAAYDRYGRVAVPLIGRLGGRPRWLGGRTTALRDDATWSQVALIQYPSRAAFVGMLRSAAYREGTPHRDAGLAATELYACTSHAEFY